MGKTWALTALAVTTLLASGCTRTSYYVPPNGFLTPEMAQCRGLSSKMNYDACLIAGRTGMSFPEAYAALHGPEVAPPLEPQYGDGLPMNDDGVRRTEPGSRR